MAPEVLKKEPYGVQADVCYYVAPLSTRCAFVSCDCVLCLQVFSFAIVLCELIMGKCMQPVHVL